MRAKNPEACLTDVNEYEKAEKGGKEGQKGKGDTPWRLLVKLVQHIWETGEIPWPMLGMIVLLIANDSSEGFHSMGCWR